MAKISIKLANGKFYPILDENSFVAKRLTLTTVREGQPSAQIDFFKRDESTGSMQYIGTLVVDGLSQQSAGETSIDLRLWTAGDGRILAEAGKTGSVDGLQKLEIDLNALDAEDLDLDGGRDSGVVMPKKRRVNPLVPIVIAAVIFFIAAGVFLFLFLSQGFPRPVNIYAETQGREESAVSPSSQNESEKAPETPPPDPVPQPVELPADNSRESFPLESFPVETNVPDTSRKALRTETVR